MAVRHPEGRRASLRKAKEFSLSEIANRRDISFRCEHKVWRGHDRWVHTCEEGSMKWWMARWVKNCSAVDGLDKWAKDERRRPSRSKNIWPSNPARWQSNLFKATGSKLGGGSESAGICAVGFSDGVVYFPVTIGCFFFFQFLEPCARFAVLLISLASHTVCNSPNTEKGETIWIQICFSVLPPSPYIIHPPTPFSTSPPSLAAVLSQWVCVEGRHVCAY